MSKNPKIERSQKAFLKSLKEKYTRDPDSSVWTKTQKEIRYLRNPHPTLIPERLNNNDGDV